MPESAEPSGSEGEQPTTIADVDSRVLETLLTTLRDNLKTVFEANRFFEEQTGLVNQAGSNNLTEALSHIGTLAEEAADLSYEEQTAQVALLDDHLRRSMMEAFEQLVKARLGKLSKLWSQYRRKAYPLIQRGKLRGLKSPADLMALRRRIANAVEDGRKSKTGTSWATWKVGANHLGQACQDSQELVDQLELGIGAAQQYRRFQLGIALAIGGVAIGLGLGLPALLG